MLASIMPTNLRVPRPPNGGGGSVLQRLTQWAVALLRETGPSQWKVSLRSRGPVDVQAVAGRRDGGGHKNAAGCKVSGDLAALKRELVADLAAALEVRRLETSHDA